MEKGKKGKRNEYIPSIGESRNWSFDKKSTITRLIDDAFMLMVIA